MFILFYFFFYLSQQILQITYLMNNHIFGTEFNYVSTDLNFFFIIVCYDVLHLEHRFLVVFF